MRKLCYLLSLLAHGLLLLAVLTVEFRVVIRSGPPRVIAVRIAEPPLPFIADGGATGATPAFLPAAAEGLSGARRGKGGAQPGGPATPSRALPPIPAMGVFSLNRPGPGTFRLGPAGKSPDPWALPIAPAPPAGSLRYSLAAGRTGATAGPATGTGLSSSVFLLPFDTRERVVADWTEAAMARIERNWIIPASARLAFAGQVQITLTIERRGLRRSLVVDGSDLPEALTVAALHAIEASLPLPPLPDDVAGEAFTFTFVFRYNG